MPSGSRTPPGALTLEITALLREFIARERWSDKAVAEAANIPQSTFSKAINGQAPLDIEQLDRIAWAVGYPLEELIKKAERNVANRQASKAWVASRLKSPKRED